MKSCRSQPAQAFLEAMSSHQDREEGPGEIVELDVDVEFSGDLCARIRLKGSPEAVIKVAPEAINITRNVMLEADRQRIRKQFFSAAHWVVFVVAGLSIAGMTAHFLNFRQFNLMFLVGMGSWTLGSIVYLYLVIVRDVFGVKAAIPKPPQH